MNKEYYLYRFAHLHTAVYRKQKAPHKAVLMLTVMAMIADGTMMTPEVELSDALVSRFKAVWNERVPASFPFTCDIGKPFFHMQHEPFWHLVNKDEALDMVAEELGLYNGERKALPAGKYTLKALREEFAGARIDDELFVLMQDAEARTSFTDLLVSLYLTDHRPSDTIKHLLTISALALIAA